MATIIPAGTVIGEGTVIKVNGVDNTPQQWGHARVNAFIVKKKKGGLNHDKDLA
jgi:hypothetical protein